MLKALTIVNPKGERLRLDPTDPYATGFNVMVIDGIGPVKATVNTSDVVTQDGVTIGGSRIDKRSISLTIGYVSTAKKSIEQLRHESYKWFPEKEKIYLEFETEERRTGTYGIVESNDITIFTKNEGSIVSVICPDPWLKDLDNFGVQNTEFSAINPMFHFPFTNKGLNIKTILFGKIDHALSKIVYYNGEAETGLKMTLTFHGVANGIEIANRDNRQTIFIDTEKMALMKESSTGKPIGKTKAGDAIIISSVAKDRYVHFVREGHSTNILNAVDRNLNWPTLRKGSNSFSYTAQTGEMNISLLLSNEILYAGV